MWLWLYSFKLGQWQCTWSSSPFTLKSHKFVTCTVEKAMLIPKAVEYVCLCKYVIADHYKKFVRRVKLIIHVCSCDVHDAEICASWTYKPQQHKLITFNHTSKGVFLNAHAFPCVFRIHNDVSLFHTTLCWKSSNIYIWKTQTTTTAHP